MILDLTIVPTGRLAGEKRCGWVCRTLRKGAAIADKIPGLGIVAKTLDLAATIISEGETLINGPRSRTMAEYEPTFSEEAILNTWFDNRFSYYLSTLLQDASDALAMPMGEAKIGAINAVLSKMMLVESHLATHDNAGLSTGAMQARLSMVHQLFTPVYEAIDNALAGSGLQKVSATISNTAYQHPIFSKRSFAVTGEVYAMGKFVNPGPVPPVLFDAPVTTVSKIVRILDINGQPIEGANSRVNGVAHSASNETGTMRFMNVPSNANVIISHQEYAPYERRASELIETIVLEPAAANQLPGADVYGKKKSSSLLLWGLGIAAAALIARNAMKNKPVKTKA